MKVLVFGEILWDIIDDRPHLGGAPFNFAAHVKQCGFEATIISAVGDDELGEKAIELAKQTGVDVSMIQFSDKRTGYVPVEIVNGQPEYEIITDVAYDHIDATMLDHERIDQHNIFYFGSLIQRGSSSYALKQILDNHQFREIFYDVNLRKDCFSAEIIRFSLSNCTILKVNDDEVLEVSDMIFNEKMAIEDFCQQVRKDYPTIHTIVITAGADGAYVYNAGSLSNVPTDPIMVKDTVGAGDSFSAAFICALHQTGDIVKATMIANKVGGFVASNDGAIPPYASHIQRLFNPA